MAEISAEPAPPRRRSRKPLLLGLVMALALGGGGFFAAYSGLLPSLLPDRSATSGQAVDSEFVAVEPMTISLGASSQSRHLRFAAALEVPRREQAEVVRLMPRIRDVLNGYLRAVDPQEFDQPGALVRIRAQMLRRVQIVTGEGRVRDLLVTEFVLN